MDALIALVVNMLTPKLLEKLKYANWFPFIAEGRPWWNRLMALVTSAAASLTALGIDVQFDAAAGIATVTGLVPENLVRTLLTVVVGFLVQEGVYRTRVRVR